MELRRGIIKAFDPASYTATVQVVGSLGNWLAGVPVAKHLAAGLLSPGSRCGVIFFDPTNPQDACLAFVYEGTPGAWVSDAMLEGSIAGSKVVAATTTARGTVELAEAGETTTALAVQANDPRLSDARLPTEHGADKHTNRTRSFWLPANVFSAVVGSPTLVSYGTGNALAQAFAFDQTASEVIGSTFVLPSDYVGGAITLTLYWAADTDTNTAHKCHFEGWWKFLVDGDNINAIQTYHPTIEPNVPSATARILDVVQLGSSATGVVAGAPGRLSIQRYPAAAADDMTGDALLLGVLIEYSADM